ncbi:Basic-leucine zipper (bZIP) transcription factor family protein [Euphorbia peplus]|nr:Basic-leucine zipper (bZIP) transcription factor family protein [Euphorbia peplus]
MAQLPPKVPMMTPNWPPFLHQNCTTTAAAAIENQNPSWDDFLDFSSTKRGVHRRSISDSIAFLETNTMPFLEESHQNDNTSNKNDKKNNYHNSSSNGLMSENLGFERLDDEQLMSMFADEMSSLTLPPTTSNPSTPSDQNSNNDEKALTVIDQQQAITKSEPGEEESSCKQEHEHEHEHEQEHHFSSSYYSNGDPLITDPKRVKRILANRQSAQRSRVRKLQYISELERSVTSLQTEVSALSPRVAFLDHQRLILNVDNSTIKQRIAALAQDKIFKDAHQEALKKEIERLRQIYQQQNINKMNTNNAPHMHHNEQKQQELLLS